MHTPSIFAQQQSSLPITKSRWQLRRALGLANIFTTAAVKLQIGINMQNAASNPLKTIKVTPLASESFGVRSMCTLVETSGMSVLLDGGISLAPYRFSLPPHPLEFQTISRLREAIAEAADKATVTTISHYHYDHHTPSFEDWVVNWTANCETARQIYKDKIVLLKNPKENINASQRERAWMFQKTGAKYAKGVEPADGKTFAFGGTELRFSEAVVHGSEGSGLGWVIMLTVECGGERFMFAPDVQGPMSNHTCDLILAAKPLVIMLGGPPLYLGGFRVNETELDRGLTNLGRIVDAVPVVVLEHHALRDEQWKLKLEKVFAQASVVGHSIITAAEFAGKENVFLESKRKQLYIDHPVSAEFKQWTRTLSNQKIARPPV